MGCTMQILEHLFEISTLDVTYINYSFLQFQQKILPTLQNVKKVCLRKIMILKNV